MDKASDQMRVALIQAPQISSGEIPVGLLALSSYICLHGYHPIIVDLNIIFERELGYPPDFFERAAEKILSFHPQVLGFSTMCNTLPASLLIASACKKRVPQIPIIFGGPEVNFDEEDILETFKQVDMIVRGEGEITFLEVLRALDRNGPFSEILGITYRNGKRIIRNPDRPFIQDLDELPHLDLSLLPQLGKYKIGGIEAGRGCPYRCTFCSTSQMWKRTFRMKSAQRLVRELEEMHCALDANADPVIGLIHDNLLTSASFSKELLSLLLNRNVLWKCSSRLDSLDDGTIRMLKQSGCRVIFLGIESGSSEMQREIKKDVPLFKLPIVLKSLVDNGIKAVLSFIVGFPNETESQINETLLFALSLGAEYNRSNVIISVSLFTFLKGSESYLELKNEFDHPTYFESNVSPFVTNLNDEITLVKKHPKLFPSFFQIASEGFLKDKQEQFHQLINFLINLFPKTTLFLLAHLSMTSFQLTKEIIASFDDEGSIYGKSRFLSRNHFTAFINVVVQKDSHELMTIMVEELYHYYRKLSNYLTIISYKDDYILFQGVLGKIMIINKSLFDKVVKCLNNESAPEIERAKKKLMEILAIMPSILDEQKLIKHKSDCEEKCKRCKHAIFCRNPDLAKAMGVKDNAFPCGEVFSHLVQENIEHIKETNIILALTKGLPDGKPRK